MFLPSRLMGPNTSYYSKGQYQILISGDLRSRDLKVKWELKTINVDITCDAS